MHDMLSRLAESDHGSIDARSRQGKLHRSFQREADPLAAETLPSSFVSHPTKEEGIGLVIKGRQLGVKRLLFRRGEVLLVIDHAVFHSKTAAFLEKNGAERSPAEASLLRQFLKL